MRAGEKKVKNNLFDLSGFQRIFVPGYETDISKEPWRESRKGSFYFTAVFELEGGKERESVREVRGGGDAH